MKWPFRRSINPSFDNIAAALSENARREDDERRLRLEKARSDRLELQLREMEIRARTKEIDDESNRAVVEQLSELIEARQMAGQGPWVVSPQVIEQTDRIIADVQQALSRGVALRESLPLNAGAYGDLGLAIQNVGWQRQVNLGKIEFSRYGIQQIILITRLAYIKSPLIRRLIDVCAAYVFARGVEISSPDTDINDIIQDFLEDNKQTLGHRALMKAERRKDYDGNLFFISFDDTVSTGESKVRLIDATEIQDIWTDPDDASSEWYFHRVAGIRTNDPKTGGGSTQTVDEWYPAYGYDPATKPAEINSKPIKWTSPVYHIKCGEVASWLFGCPRAYPALQYAKEAEKYMAACASVKQSNAQIAREIASKGGQQAIEGIKAQLGTTVGPATPFLDMNPPAVSGATFAHGPGTTMSLLKQRGMSDDPHEVVPFLWFVCMVFGVPETFLAYVSTGNLATATSLDRPTETIMIEKQEEWREDLLAIVKHYLEVSKAAPGGKLREALKRRGITDVGSVAIRECARVPARDGTRMQYARLEVRESKLYEAQKAVPKTDIVVKVDFPEIREGDKRMQIEGLVQSMTLGNRAGQVIGIDEKESVRALYTLNGFENGDEITEQQYPESKYEIDRTKEVLPPPIQRPKAFAGGTIADDVQVDADGNPVTTSDPHQGEDQRPKESDRLRAAVQRLNRALDLTEAGNRNGR